MRRDYLEPLTEITREEQAESIVVPEDGCYRVYVNDPSRFQTATPLKLGQQDGWIRDRDPHSLLLTLPSSDGEPTSEETVTQTVALFDTPDLFTELTNYWRQFWHVPDPDREVPADFRQFADKVQQVPAFHVEVRDPDLWMQAIRQQKSTSARGIDGISGAELKQLPRATVTHLAKIMASMSIFPPWFMVALTVALPKVSGPIRVSQVRPITILAMLYRTWSRVVSQQILCRFANMMPQGITGFLKHRGPMDACMALAHHLETSRHNGMQLTGVVLDLQKCFNTICRRAAATLMRKLGVPPWLVSMWFDSLQQMDRMWTINRQCSSTFQTNNGCPEGDSLSIVAMLSLGYTWLVNVADEVDNPRATCYADNWGWTLQDPDQHSIVLDITRRFTQCTRMRVDWSKTWTWATGTDFSQRTVALFEQELPSHDIPHLSNAMDLGCQHVYRGCPKLGKYQDRLVHAKHLLKRVESMPHDTTTKTHLIMGGIYPLAFYGLEVLPLGLHHFQKLRPGISNAILGHCDSRNSAIAISCTPRLEDPLVYVMLKILRTCRRFLITLTAVERSLFYAIASSHSTKHTDCHGPAGCLAYYLSKFDWELDDEGNVWVNTAISLSLLHTGIKTFRQWLEISRQHGFLTEVSQRQILHGLVVDTLETKRVISKYSAQSQQQLLNEISGGFQLATQKSKWAEDATDRCNFCSQQDSRFHRVHECEAFAHLRRPYQDVLDHFLGIQSLVHELPVIFLHDDFEVLQVVAYQHVEAQITPAMLTRIRQICADGRAVPFYTDGSLMYPESITTRHGAYAMILDLCSTDAERAQAGEGYLLTGQMPASLTPLSMARVTGRRTIHRAELTAVVKLTEWFNHTVIYIDSQNVIDLVARCRQSTDVYRLADAADFDLVVRLWGNLQSGTHTFCKLKSHVDPSMVSDPLERYHALGNQRADMAASEACRTMYPQEANLWTQMANSVKDDVARLRRLYDYYLELHTARAKQEQLDKQQANHGLENTTRQSQLDILQQWQVTDAWPVPRPQVDFSRSSVMGPRLSNMYMTWVRKLRWPAEHVVQLDDPGVTYIELAISFMVDSQCYIPVKRPKQDGTLHLCLPFSGAEAEAQQVVIAELALMFSYWAHQMNQLVYPPPLPDMAHTACRGLYRLGAKTQAKGYAKRPVLPQQHRVMELLSELTTRHGLQMPQQVFVLEEVAVDRSIQGELLTSWSGKQERVKRTVQQVRGLIRHL
eukprot:Skav236568  [mRNA]  locus=scaffold2180:68365:72048:+ [translate_table: standard]